MNPARRRRDLLALYTREQLSTLSDGEARQAHARLAAARCEARRLGYA